jgi:two-component system chemotaxis response regulator CheY
MKKRIVLVDDFENTRFVIKSSLRNIDAEILEAGDGTEAVQFFDGQRIDLLITDYNMPEMDGATLVSKVRAMNAYQFMPAIMLTTERSQEKKERAMAIKVTAWVQKPFKQDEFQKIIRKALQIV